MLNQHDVRKTPLFKGLREMDYNPKKIPRTTGAVTLGALVHPIAMVAQ